MDDWQALFVVLWFVFELANPAFCSVNVIPFTEIHWLKQHVALLMCIQVANFDHITGFRDLVIGMDCDVQAPCQPPVTEQNDR